MPRLLPLEEVLPPLGRGDLYSNHVPAMIRQVTLAILIHRNRRKERQLPPRRLAGASVWHCLSRQPQELGSVRASVPVGYTRLKQGYVAHVGLAAFQIRHRPLGNLGRGLLGGEARTGGQACREGTSASPVRRHRTKKKHRAWSYTPWRWDLRTGWGGQGRWELHTRGEEARAMGNGSCIPVGGGQGRWELTTKGKKARAMGAAYRLGEGKGGGS
eukprot:scaffold1021_cov108-Isochrysis_galbana.AAC.10